MCRVANMDQKKIFTNKCFAKRKVFSKLADVYGYFKKILKFHQQARKKELELKFEMQACLTREKIANFTAMHT